jgi:TolA-binding protein
MTVVGLHPEELLDKLFDGEITQLEHERLRQHLAACDVCRFEYAARGDFQAEALTLAAEGPPPMLPLRSPLPAAVATAPARRRRSRIVVWGLAAAALITASGAVASGLVGKAPWSAVSLLFSKANVPASQPVAVVTASALVRPGCKGADCVPASKPTAQGDEAAPLANVPAAAQERLEPAQPAADPVPTRHGPLTGRLATPKAAPAISLASTSATSDVKEAAKEPAAATPATSAKLFGEANQARRSGDIGRASGLYRLLQEQFPGSAEAELSRVTLSLLLLDSGDAQGALVGFERYLAGASRGLEAEALVGRARALGRLGRRDLEASAWREVQRKYPRSIYGRQATERLAALGQP